MSTVAEDIASVRVCVVVAVAPADSIVVVRHGVPVFLIAGRPGDLAETFSGGAVVAAPREVSGAPND